MDARAAVESPARRTSRSADRLVAASGAETTQGFAPPVRVLGLNENSAHGVSTGSDSDRVIPPPNTILASHQTRSLPLPVLTSCLCETLPNACALAPLGTKCL